MGQAVPGRAHYMINVLDALRALGGEAHRKEVFAWMGINGIARPEDVGTIQTDGGTRFRKHVDFSRKELLDGGLIQDFDGVWSLTASGESTFLDHSTANQIVRLNQKLRPLRQLRQRDPRVQRPNNGPTTGPKPSSWAGAVSRNTLQPAVTYILRWEDIDLWKIGHAIDVKRRVSQINKHVPVEVLDASWNVVRTQQWDNCVLAHEMEQEVFTILARSRSQGERLRCPAEQLLIAWEQARATVAASIEN